jgi:RHS repeat-associated protein
VRNHLNHHIQRHQQQSGINALGQRILKMINTAIPTGSQLNATITAGTITCANSGPQAQTITNFTNTPAGPVTYAVAPNNTFTLSATGGGSGNPVTYTSTTPTVCTTNGTNGSTVTKLTAGNCVVTADQAGTSTGNPTYIAAPQQTLTILINKATQTITDVAPTTISYQPAPNNTFTLSATSSGSTNPTIFASSAPNICTTSGTNGATVTILSAGTCTLTVNQAGDTNYLAANEVAASVTITKASQSITNFTPPTTLNQAVASTISLSATGGGIGSSGNSGSGNLVTFTSTTPAVCTTSGSTQGSNNTSVATLTIFTAGTCTITANQAGNDNYSAAPPLTASISITPPVVNAPAQLYFIHPDHLGTPRVITKATDNTKVWEWKNDDPFGNNLPNEDPNSTGTSFKFNNRFEGQYYDEETGIIYNWNRFYDSAIGRYTQSDPIGLRGGINTYLYALNDPLSLTDEDGLRSRPQQRYQSPYGQPPTMPSSRELRRAGEPPVTTPQININQNARDIFNRLADRPLDNPVTPGVYPGVNIPWTLPLLPPGPNCMLICPKKYQNACDPDDEKPCVVYCGSTFK